MAYNTPNFNFVPRAEEHDCTYVVRGAMHQAMFVGRVAFEKWLEFEGYAHSSWTGDINGHASCLLYRPDGTVAERCSAHRISHMMEG